MRTLKNTLPPPNMLIVFEAAGRHLSFTRAALDGLATLGYCENHSRQLDWAVVQDIGLSVRTQDPMLRGTDRAVYGGSDGLQGEPRIGLGSRRTGGARPLWDPGGIPGALRLPALQKPGRSC